MNCAAHKPAFRPSLLFSSPGVRVSEAIFLSLWALPGYMNFFCKFVGRIMWNSQRGRNVRARGSRGPQGSSVFRTHIGWHDVTRPVQVQARPNPSMKREAGCEVPHLFTELLATVGCWEERGQCSMRVQPLESQPHSCWRPYVQEYLNSTSWPWWGRKKDTKLGGKGRCGSRRSWGKEGDMIKTHYMNISKTWSVTWSYSMLGHV